MEPLISLAVRVAAPGSRRRLTSLHAALRAAILEGRLRADAKLPSTRTMARSLGVGRNTVLAAYDMLASEGYVRSALGSGTYVAQVTAGRAPVIGSAPRRLPRDLMPRAWRCASPLTLDTRQFRFDFRVGVPDMDKFPRTVWRRLLIRAQRRAARSNDAYAGPAGDARLRAAIAAHVSHTRAVACETEDVIVTSGAQHAFDLIARVLVVPHRTLVALEQPGYAPLAAVFRSWRARIVSVPVDEHGLVANRVPAGAHIVCVTPSHQFPLGGVLPIERRLLLVEHARRQGAVIIEDDYDGEFRFAGRPLDALKTLDQWQSVFYVGSFSKLLSPELRLGFMIVPPWARDPLLAALQINSWRCPGAAQHALADFILEGHLARHLRHAGREYAAKRAVLQDALRTQLSPLLTPIPSSAGLHIAARLAGPWNAEALMARARERDVAIESVAGGIVDLRSRRRPCGEVLFGYGCISQTDIPAGIKIVRDILQEKMPKRMPSRAR
jgi:GntR family transcriptional regulator / MocR family aminotransferase